MAAEISLGSFGEATPLIGIRFEPSDGASSAARKAEGSFLAEVSKTMSLEAASAALATALGVPTEAVTLMHEGRTLDLTKSLPDNEITIPGARARREGEKVVLGFDTQFLVMQDVEKEQRKRQEAIEREKRKLADSKRRKEEQEKKAAMDAERARLAKERQTHATTDFLNHIAQNVGVEYEEFQRLLANPDPDVKKPRHYLERATLPQERALADLLSSSGGGRDVTAAFRIVNEELRQRYQRAKEGLRGAGIPPHAASTTSKVKEQKANLSFLEEFDPSVNELCLWHGTGKMEGAGGICANGFDIAYVGSAVGTAWGHGFYFADNAGTSLGYTGSGVRVNDTYTSVRIMFLCRVLCGRVQELSQTPTPEQKEALTAKCLGPGGVFGPKSEVHSIHGGKWCYVCAHNHQVYPEYILFLR
mmetsp:Transcript_6511/g.14994  ORF Transcript_6511/g.14994 Transcript_6511/m.14994 type:complete len:418 (+) Transcript_6511:52-1305(+)